MMVVLCKALYVIQNLFKSSHYVNLPINGICSLIRWSTSQEKSCKVWILIAQLNKHTVTLLQVRMYIQNWKLIRLSFLNS